MTGNSKIITFKAKEYIPGQMEENTSEIGKIIKWMDQESSLGQVFFTFIVIDGRKYVGQYVDDKK